MAEHITLSIGHLTRKFDLQAKFIANAIGMRQSSLSRRAKEGGCLSADEGDKLLVSIEIYNKTLSKYLKVAVKKARIEEAKNNKLSAIARIKGEIE